MKVGSDKLPQTVPLQVGERFKRRVNHAGRAKIQYIFSDEMYLVFRTPNMSGGPHVINK